MSAGKLLRAPRFAYYQLPDDYMAIICTKTDRVYLILREYVDDAMGMYGDDVMYVLTISTGEYTTQKTIGRKWSDVDYELIEYSVLYRYCAEELAAMAASYHIECGKFAIAKEGFLCKPYTGLPVFFGEIEGLNHYEEEDNYKAWQEYSSPEEYQAGT